MGNVLTATADKDKAFNSYFCSIFTKENLRSLLQASWSTASISDVVIDEDSVFEALGRIDPSKACGPDEIPGRLLKEVHHGLLNHSPDYSTCPCSQGVYHQIGEEPT